MTKPAEAQRKLLAPSQIVRGRYLVDMSMVIDEVHGERTSIDARLSDVVAQRLREIADRIDSEATGAESNETESVDCVSVSCSTHPRGTEKPSGPCTVARGASEAMNACGCRCNCANATPSSHHRSIRAELDMLEAEFGFDPLNSLIKQADRVDEVSEHRLVNVHDVGGAVVSVVPGRGNVNSRLEPFADLHDSSPVVAETEAATSVTPAMTVQEGGGSDAATGTDGASPAFSVPRFVAIGGYVYDRDENRVTSSGASAYRACLLNEGSFRAEVYDWENVR